MDIDTLIFILVFLAVVISNIKRILTEGKKKKDAEQPEQKGQPGKTDFLQKLVEKVVSRIQEEVAPQVKETRSREAEPGKLSGWDAIVGREDSFEPSYDEEDVHEEHDEHGYVPLELDEEELSEIKEPEKEVPPQPEVVLTPEEPSDPEQYPEPTPSVYSVRELQKAVIWSEIIGPPVALKEDQG